MLAKILINKDIIHYRNKGNLFMTLYAVILAAWLLAGALGYRFLKQNPGYKFTGGRAVLYAVMAVGLAVRLVLAARDYAFAVDIN